VLFRLELTSSLAFGFMRSAYDYLITDFVLDYPCMLEKNDILNWDLAFIILWYCSWMNWRLLLMIVSWPTFKFNLTLICF